MSHDPMCHELARAFLSDEPSLNDENHINKLAEGIQGLIEDWIEDWIASLDPQQLHGGKAWYYEYPGSIEIIVPKDAPNLGISDGTKAIRIPARMLLKSLERMGKISPKRGGKR